MDWQADALYIKFQNGKFARNQRVDDDTMIDLDAKGRLLGIEILNVTKKVPAKDLSGIRVKLPPTQSAACFANPPHKPKCATGFH